MAAWPTAGAGTPVQWPWIGGCLLAAAGGWGQIFVKPRHGKHELPPGDATDDTATLPLASALLLHLCSSCWPTFFSLVFPPAASSAAGAVERDSNLEITETLASAPCAPAPNASFCWLAATGGTRPVWRQHKAPAGESLWWSKLVAKWLG